MTTEQLTTAMSEQGDADVQSTLKGLLGADVSVYLVVPLIIHHRDP